MYILCVLYLSTFKIHKYSNLLCFQVVCVIIGVKGKLVPKEKQEKKNDTIILFCELSMRLATFKPC